MPPLFSMENILLLPHIQVDIIFLVHYAITI